MGELVDRRYGIVETLGGGGMAEVFLARDEVLGRDVALKVLRREHSQDADFAERFRREAQSAAALSHPNIVPVYDRGEAEDGSCYISMEYLPGGTLAGRISRDAPMSLEVVVEVALQIAEALAAAHERGVVHRDVKPQNVLVTKSGDVKVGDFGIARAESASSLTGDAVLGTAAYMSPEQATGRRVGPQSDLYSLGVVMYEMLTGEPPYGGGGSVAVAMRHAEEAPVPPKDKVPDIPEALNALVLKLLAKAPENRPVSAEALADELRRLPKAGEAGDRAAGSPDTETVPASPGATRPTRVYPEDHAEGRTEGRAGGRAGGRGRPRRAPAGVRLKNLVPWLLVLLFVAGVVLGGMLVVRVLGSGALP